MASSSQQEMRESSIVPDPDARRRITVKSSPIPVVPNQDAKRRITMTSSSLTRPVITPARSSGSQCTDSEAESRMNIDDDSKTSTDMRTPSSGRS